ncbi:MAG: hypothetical protein F6K04_26230, partial [Leptolyngbya sp. SIO4C5]|nr:hypothetical protein [Leptolyngbya sp. SIO4C5]
STLLTPAFIFWAGGAIVLMQRRGWQDTIDWFEQQPEYLRLAMAIAAFLLIAISAVVIQRFDLAVLRFLEGYWPRWLNPLRRWRIAQAAKRSRKIGDRWQALAQINPAQLTPQQRDDLAQFDWQQRQMPLPHESMPTQLGNLLRAAERKPKEKYGLDAIICWSRLWLLLPDAAKQDLQAARADLNTAARVWLWSMLFCGWALLSLEFSPSFTVNLWALWPLLGLLSAWLAYQWAIAAAQIYGELIEASFDLYRHLLYESLRWHLPADPNVERRVGAELTEYLWRGF